MVDAPIAFSRPLGIGEVLDGGLRLFRASLLKCLPYAAVAALAGQLPSAYSLATGRGLKVLAASRDPAFVPIYLLATCVTLCMWSAVILRQQRIAAGQPLDAAAEVGEALRRLPATAGASLLAGLAVGLGIVLLVIPGIYLATALSLWWPVLLIDRVGPGAALSGSQRLVAGHWWRTTAILTAAIIMLFVFYAIGGIVGAFAAIPLAGSADVVIVSAVMGVVFLLLGALAVPLFGALMLAIYSDLKVRREGSDLSRRILADGGA